MKTSNLILGSILLALAATGSAQATSLADLMNGGSLTVGDKTFDDFTAIYSRNNSSTAPDASFNYDWGNIDVTGLNDGGDYGLKFTLTNALTSIGDDFSDLFFGFHVEAASPFFINGLSLDASGQTSGDGQWAVGEVAGTSLDEVISKADLGDYAAWIDSSHLFDDTTAGLGARSDYYIGKNLLVSSIDGSASLNSFEQRFHQTSDVPEPGMLMLLVAGLTGLFFDARRRNQRQG